MENRIFNIAIVDDETEILDLLNRFLSRNPKFKVSSFSNPLTFLTSNDSSKYDLVLLDIMMPQMNGIDVLEKIRDKGEEQKVIMMTAYSTLDKVLKSHKEGATHYIMKPFSSLEILEKQVLEILNEN